MREAIFEFLDTAAWWHRSVTGPRPGGPRDQLIIPVCPSTREIIAERAPDMKKLVVCAALSLAALKALSRYQPIPGLRLPTHHPRRSQRLRGRPFE
jgi:hypothetical protein